MKNNCTMVPNIWEWVKLIAEVWAKQICSLKIVGNPNQSICKFLQLGSFLSLTLGSSLPLNKFDKFYVDHNSGIRMCLGLGFHLCVPYII